MNKWLIGFLLWLWQIPQNLLAFIIIGFLGYLCYYAGKFKEAKLVHTEYIISSFSLGDYIFTFPSSSEDIRKHELGHCRQSKILGWLYLPVIAMPSLLLNIYCKILRALKKPYDYSNFYTEKWANKLVENLD